MIYPYLILVLIPALVLSLSYAIKIAMGPYWLAGNFDPAYLYLVNGLHILKGVAINDATHPGTPLQSLCGATCWFFNMGRPIHEVAKNVFTSPEFYLQAVFIILTSATFMTSLGLSFYVFRKTQDKLAAVLVQLPTLSYLVLKSRDALEPVLPVAVNVSPEGMLISVINLFNLFLLMHLFAKTSREQFMASLMWGFICGLGTAVKFTFLPLLMIPLIVLSWKNKFLLAGIFIGSFILWTIPALSKYALQWGFIKSFLVHGGGFKADGHESFDISTFCSNWMGFIKDYKVFFILLEAGIFLLIWKRLNRSWDRSCFYLLATVCGVVFQFAVVTKNPGAHYLLPGLGMLGIILFFVYRDFLSGSLIGRRGTFVFIIIFSLVGIWQANNTRQKIADFTRDIVGFHDQMRQKYQGCTMIDYYRTSDPAFALFFGDGWNREFQFRDELFEVYPHSYIFSKGGDNHISSFKGIVWSNDLLAANACVLFRGDGDVRFNELPFNLRLLEKGRFESIHLLTGTTEKQAAILFDGAIQLFQAGDIPRALIVALQAKNLHYQPDGAVTSLINLFRLRLNYPGNLGAQH